MAYRGHHGKAKKLKKNFFYVCIRVLFVMCCAWKIKKRIVKVIFVFLIIYFIYIISDKSESWTSLKKVYCLDKR